MLKTREMGANIQFERLIKQITQKKVQSRRKKPIIARGDEKRE